MATINLPANGQTLTDIPDYIANDDKLLRDLLAPTMPDLANATFERKEANGLLTVTVSKRAGTKGIDERIEYCIDAELGYARRRFPGSNLNFPALVEEVGELAQALLDHSFGKKPAADVYAEAIQVAVMAIRVAEEGSSEFPYKFDHSHYQAFNVNKTLGGNKDQSGGAPDLLAACESALKAMERATSEDATIFDQIEFGDMLQLRVAIQKAKGVQ
jgi:hypothetical protein